MRSLKVLGAAHLLLVPISDSWTWGATGNEWVEIAALGG